MSIRIIGLGEVSTIQDGDFIAVDNATNGTHKFDATKLGASVASNLAPAYSTAATYAIGEFCMHDNALYRCTTAITSPEAWTASHWVQVTVGTSLYDKVDKVEGMGLSENDFTDALKSKLDGIAAGAEVNVQSDWSQTNTGADDYIKNKPGDATTTTAGLMSAADKTKLNGIASGAEVNVQADWSQTNTSADDYIKNKPGNASGSAAGLMSSADKQKLDGIAAGAEVNVQANWAETNTSADDYIKNKPGVATESTDGLMSSSDKTKLDGIANGAEVNVQADWNQTNTSADDFIKNKPVDATESVGGLMSATDKAKLDGIQAGAEVNVQADWAQTDNTADDFIKNKDLVTDVLTDLEENKANIDGSYDDMTVGNAEQLVSSVAIDEHQPYNFRPSGGSVDIGDRKTEEIVGGSLAWNQLVPPISNSKWDVNGAFGTGSKNDGKFTYSITSKSQSQSFYISNGQGGIPLILGHKYLSLFDITLSEDTSSAALILQVMDNQNLTTSPAGTISANTKSHRYRIFELTTTSTNAFFGIFPNMASGLNVGSTAVLENPQIFDLTAMFGSTIADYIYTLEQANEGAGVARFRKYFPKSYYAYDAGSLQSVNVGSGIMTGLNQWDEEWEVGQYNNVGDKINNSQTMRSKNYIPIFPSISYCITVPYPSVTSSVININFYDSGKVWISNLKVDSNGAVFNTPNNAYYMTFNVTSTYGNTYNNDICINLHWDGEYDGVYEPYITHTYQYDPALELRGIPKLDENNYLTYDGDVYESDGTVTRKYGIVDLGTLDWIYVNSSSHEMMRATMSSWKRPSGSSEVANGVLSAKGIVISGNAVYLHEQEGISKTADADTINYYSASMGSDATAFKTAMSGVYLVYELATPTTEQAEPYTNPQIVNDFGTESFIDSLVEAGTRDVSIPVGHNTKYLANLKAKLEMAPNSPDGDGKYIVQQTDGMNYYVNFDPLIANKANVDGAYEDMTVGNAEQLLASVYTDDQIPYNFRQSGGGISVGDREIDKVVGGTIAWNQLVQNGNFASDSNWYAGANCVKSISNNELSFIVSAQYASVYQPSFKTVSGHKYLFSAIIKSETNSAQLKIYCGSGITGKNVTVGTSFENVSFLDDGDATGDYYLYIQDNRASDWTNIHIKHIMLFDLTAMFGSTIADYIYTLETTNAGDGVAYFRNLFPEPYYAYDAGSLQSVNTSVHEMVGFNQWDEEWELGYYGVADGAFVSRDTGICSKRNKPISVIPNTQYNITVPYPSLASSAVLYYDANDNYISWDNVYSDDGDFITPSNARYVRFYLNTSYGTTYNNDICINLSHNGSRNGEYEPYVKHTYPLDSSLTLRGVPKLDSSNRLYYDGDVYHSDGIVDRIFNIITFDGSSDEEWSRYAGGSAGAFAMQIDMPDAYLMDGYILSNSLQVISINTTWGNYDNWVSYGNSHNLCTGVQSITTVDGWRTYLSTHPLTIVYKLATPTTETATTYQNPQVVNDWGTEEYVDYAYTQGTRDVAVPVGHYTEYLPNLRDKLQVLPDAAGSNGTYVIEQTGGQMALTPLTTPKEIPDAPTSTDGTYNLQVVVSGGTATYSWVSAT